MKWQPARYAPVNALVMLVLPCLFFLSTAQLKAEYLTENIPYGLTFPSGTFNTGDTVEIIIWAGDANTQLSEVVGFSLDYVLTSNAQFPSSVEPDFDQSWIANGESLSNTTTLNSSSREMSFYALNVDLSSDGSGEIGRFILVAAANNVQADELMAGHGGGVVIQVDDLGLRTGNQPNPSQLNQPALYPNPSSGLVRIGQSSDKITHWVLQDTNGRLIQKGSQFPIDLNQLNIPNGLLLLRVYTYNEVRFDYKLSYYR